MKKIYLALVLIFSHLIIGLSQVQISDVQNVALTDNANRKFIGTSEKLLLIEFSGFSTIVYQLNENGATKTQEWVYDYKDQSRLSLNENKCYLMGDTLFEIFNKSIVATNILDGKQVGVHMMPDSVQNVIKVDFDASSDNWMVTYTDENYVNHYGMINIKTGVFTGRKLTDGYRIGNMVYKLSNSTLISENIYTGELTTSFSGITNKFNPSSTKTAPYLWIGTTQGDNYYIDSDHGMRKIECLIPPQTASLYWVDSLLFCNISTSPSFTFNVINTNTCNLETGNSSFFKLFVPGDQ